MLVILKQYTILSDCLPTTDLTLFFSLQFTKQQGVFANPTSAGSPAKLRLAFEAAPFGLLVEKAGGKTSDGVTGNSILDVVINSVDQRTALCLGSSNEVDRFNEMICMVE
jgi:sedoheptulose-bisphosphatase